MTDDAMQALTRAREAHIEQQERAKQTLAAYHAAIAEAAREGVRQRDLVEATGFTREHIRKICKPE